MVELGDSSSLKWELLYGVPRGSILSLMLFNIYMKPLGEIIRRFGAGCYQYADDTQIYFSLSSSSSSSGNGIHSLNACLQAVMGWMRDNKLKLNPCNTEVLIVGDWNLRDELDLPALDGVTFPQKEQVRSLGVLLDPDLTIVSQVEAMARSAFYLFRLIRQLRPFLENNDLKTVVHQLVTSRLDYCNALYMGLPLYVVQKLQLVQNAAARLVSGVTRRDHIMPVLKQLHWLPICFQAKYKVLVITFKALNGFGPGYLRERLLRYDPHRSLRSSGEVRLQLPPVRLVATQNQAFCIAAPGLWNALLADIQSLGSLLAFKRALKTYLFGLAFQGL
ncbi:uncharacterized protein LOC128343844 [Hemicordylus capensis]|uniref:uncharacterized protein LOC128343844 n=1 Tax=Hemicordylus capensis TaxID=884348 RepID=UPI002304C829|nr:uncharacterized protein LOC128343844 [Hemicordylus capensis]XP_053149263.1 uncharacterized protein LOC128343844 [Hemicordylus capensis]XP_053149272.1 uncharacterized protein LOC128343844 [Hemicordylus capensis]XP_053149277.1 uncharacterized protein LOC128343844 [Hemicordylus capensis]